MAEGKDEAFHITLNKPAEMHTSTLELDRHATPNLCQDTGESRQGPLRLLEALTTTH